MASDTFFEKVAHPFVLKWEGGLCDDKNDAGGITKYGVSLRFLKSIRADADRQTIIDLTLDEARQIFYDNFWIKCRCHELPDEIAFVLYDTAVNVGCKQAIKFLQRSLGVVDDGIMGRGTFTSALHAQPANHLPERMIRQRELFYQNLAKNKPTQKVFLKGWLNRCYDLRKALGIKD